MGALEHRAVSVRTLHNLEHVAHRRERISELVSERGEKLVLALIDGREIRCQSLQIVHQSHSIGNVTHDLRRANNVPRVVFNRRDRERHDEALTILVALPGVELDSIKVTLNAGTLLITGERPPPPELKNARILRMEIPYGRFERRIDLPPVPFEISGRHLADGCLMLSLRKGLR